MRTIKFRGQRIVDNVWVYGYYVHYNGNSYIYNEDHSDNADSYYNNLVVDETVGQLLFTTISNLQLYDGDIFDIGQTINGQSEFIIMQGEYGIVINYNYDRTRKYEYSIEGLLNDDMDEIKVIGNIYTIPLTPNK